MNNFRIFVLLIICAAQLVACSDNSIVAAEAKKPAWWQSVVPIVIDGDEFYGKPCSVTRVSVSGGIKLADVIFTVPSRLLTSCANRKPGKNYLKLAGEYIVLHVDRQTFGAGAWTAERYRSSDFRSWQEYIGVSWVAGEAHEAWRNVGSTSSQADSRTSQADLSVSQADSRTSQADRSTSQADPSTKAEREPKQKVK